MKLPLRFSKGHDEQVCQLKKSLYGLKQAPWCWFTKLSEALKLHGFSQTRSDYMLFTYTACTTFLCVLVYVDDLINIGNDSEAILSFKSHLNSIFHKKDLGHLKYFWTVKWLVVLKESKICTKCFD